MCQASCVIWGKAPQYRDEDGNKYNKWTPLWLHLRDTAQVSRILWDDYTPSHIKRLIADDCKISHDDARELLCYLAGVHDVGKSSPDFSGREGVRKSTTKLYDRMVDNGFTYPVRDFLRHEVISEYALMDSIPGDDVFIKQTLGAVLAGHHGKPLNLPEGERVHRGLSEEWKDSISDMFELAKSITPRGFEVVCEMAKLGLTWRAQVLLTSLVIQSDWIASTEELFPLFDIDEVPDIGFDFQPERTRRAFDSIVLPTPIDAEKIDLSDSFEERFGKRFDIDKPSLRPVQQALLDLVSDEQQDANDVFIVEAPMGEGKTEAALLASEILMKRSGMSGVFFGLPTMATGEAIYKRVLPYLRSFANTEDFETTLALAHSKAHLSDTYTKQKSDIHFGRGGGLIDEGWLKSSRMKMMNGFVVGTIDNFLMLSLKLKWSYWKHLGFASKVIVLDEVHSSDEYMDEYLQRSLVLAGFYELPVVLLSATLHSGKREELIKAYVQGKKVATSIV